MLSSTLTTLQEVAFDFKHDNFPTKSIATLPQAILKTLAYFDIFNFPLTAWEIYKYLWVEDLADKSVSYLAVRQALNELANVNYQDGFYFLNGQSELVRLRQQRQIIARAKYRRARWVVALFSVLPFTKMIAVCNSLAYDNARAESDIDFFIIAQAGKVWTARFLTTLALKFLRLRPTAITKQNKICVNFIIGADALNLQLLMIAGDIYFKYWLKQLVPLYNQGGILEKFIKANDFIGDYINNPVPALFCHKRKIGQGPTLKFIKLILEIINGGSWVERLCKNIQLKVMPRSLREQAGKGTAVVMSDSVLKFHSNDRREEYRQKWQEHITHNT
ncbi:MAG: hypothetical protein AAB956_03225 [Patescibacteria group bacterium]